jgi:hypothetical protein
LVRSLGKHVKRAKSLKQWQEGILNDKWADSSRI